MKKSLVLTVMILVAGYTYSHARSGMEEFNQTLLKLEESGGQDQKLQEKLCGLGISILNQLRAQILASFPALQERKNRVEAELARLVRKLQNVGKNSKDGRRLESKKKELLFQLGEIEDEVEAQLHARADLSQQFDRVHGIMQEWCE